MCGIAGYVADALPPEADLLVDGWSIRWLGAVRMARGWNAGRMPF